MSVSQRIVGGAMLFLLCMSIFFEWKKIERSSSSVTFLDVGQGDSAMIQTDKGGIIVIDGGPDWSLLEKISNYMPFFIDLLIFLS